MWGKDSFRGAKQRQKLKYKLIQKVFKKFTKMNHDSRGLIAGIDKLLCTRWSISVVRRYDNENLEHQRSQKNKYHNGCGSIC